MGRKRQYIVAGQIFKTQAELEAKIKAQLNSHPLNTEFQDTFLAAVVNELHPDVIKAGQKVVRFIYLSPGEQEKRNIPTAIRFRGGKLLMGYFIPLNEWRDVTVYPWRKSTDPKVEIKKALRGIIADYLPKPTKDDFCAIPGCRLSGYSVELHHINPTFDQIADECIALMTDEEINSLFHYEKFKPGAYTLADFIRRDHPAVKHLIERHKDSQWVWLCPRHHRNVKGD